MYQSIATEVDDSVGILTLNKAVRHNAMDGLLVKEISDGLIDLESDPRVRVIVLSSTGKSFCGWYLRCLVCFDRGAFRHSAGRGESVRACGHRRTQLPSLHAYGRAFLGR